MVSCNKTMQQGLEFSQNLVPLDMAHFTRIQSLFVKKVSNDWILVSCVGLSSRSQGGAKLHSGA